MSPLLVAEGLSLVSGGHTRVADLSLTVEAGDAVAVVGPNGAGKTSLLRVLLGLEPGTGRIELGGTAMASLDARERAARVSWLPQHSKIRDALPAVEVVRSARYRFRESGAERTEHAHRSMAELDIQHLAGRTMDTLSGGESQRVALAALHAQDAALLCLDEPANHLDPAVQLATWSVLGQWRAEGRGLLVVTHDLSLIRFLGPAGRVRVLGMQDGSTRFLMPSDDPGLPEALTELFGVRIRRIDVDGTPHLVVAP